MKLLLDSDALISATELVELIGADPESVSNWIRRDIITRTPLGGRSTRNRLFSTEEVYKTALKYELIKMGLPPSSASDAINDLWKGWWAQELPEGKDICAILVPTGEKWSASLCWQKKSGGTLYVFGAAAVSLHAQTKTPVYFVSEIDVTNPEAYGKEFAPKAQATIKAAGGRFIAIGGTAGVGAKPITAISGTAPKRVTIQAWDSLDALNAWYKGADYQEALKIGEKYATFRRYAVEGQ